MSEVPTLYKDHAPKEAKKLVALKRRDVQYRPRNFIWSIYYVAQQETVIKLAGLFLWQPESTGSKTWAMKEDTYYDGGVKVR